MAKAPDYGSYIPDANDPVYVTQAKAAQLAKQQPLYASGQGTPIFNNPGGIDGYVQYNSASSFGGDVGFTYNSITRSVNILGNLNVGGYLNSKFYTNFANLKISGGNEGDIMFTDGLGNLSWGNLDNYLTSDVLAAQFTSFQQGNVSFTGANVSLGNISNLHIPGGSPNYILSTDGAGNLTWIEETGGGPDRISIHNGTSNVAVPDSDGNVYVNVNDTYQWVYNTDGELLAGGQFVALQGELTAGAGYTFDETSRDTGMYSDNDGHLKFKTNDKLSAYYTDNDVHLYTKSADYLTTYDWHLDREGNLTLPTGGAINYANGVSILDGVVGGQSDRLVNGDKEVILGSDGFLTVPGGGKITNNGTSIDLVAGVEGWAELASNNGDSFVWVDDNGAYVVTSGTGSFKQWTFEQDGNFTLPSTTAAINYSNGVSILAGVVGTSSSIWTTGSGLAPAPGTNPNDQYLDNDTGNVYQWDGETWILTGNIKGPTGADGADGAPGADALWNWQGTYSDGPQYQEGDIVAYQGSTYRRNGVDIGTFAAQPILTQYWEVVSVKGTDGAPGVNGVDGADGVNGTNGINGVGDPGPKGDKGDTGDQGVSVTLQGTKATIADLPLTGNAGDGWIVTTGDGSTHLDGSLWFWNVTDGAWNDVGPIVGPKGDKGDTGERGLTGDPGTNGINGTNGTDGAPGANGIDGAPGANGADGIDGIDGASAYEVAVSNGFVGTEVEWLASLVGADGIDANIGDFIFTNNIATVGTDSRIGLDVDGGTNVYMSPTTDDSTALFINTTSVQAYATEQVSVQAGSYNWSFDNAGTLTAPDTSELRINRSRTSSTDSDVLGGANSVIYSAASWATSFKLIIKVEGRLDGDVTSVDHTQTCEATIAATYNTSAEPVISVYGIVYTSPTPLATFTVRRGAGTIEVLALNSQTTETLHVSVYAIKFGSYYD